MFSHYICIVKQLHFIVTSQLNLSQKWKLSKSSQSFSKNKTGKKKKCPTKKDTGLIRIILTLNKTHFSKLLHFFSSFLWGRKCNVHQEFTGSIAVSNSKREKGDPSWLCSFSHKYLWRKYESMYPPPQLCIQGWLDSCLEVETSRWVGKLNQPQKGMDSVRLSYPQHHCCYIVPLQP